MSCPLSLMVFRVCRVLLCHISFATNRNRTELIESRRSHFWLFIYFSFFISFFLFCCRRLVSRNIASAPVMESPPENRTVRDGRDETFNCKAGGAPTPNITWIFNG